MSTDGTPNTITLPAGTYTLTIPGALEFGSAAGSLDVNGGNLTIAGAGADATIIDANHLDPVLALCPDLATSCGGHGVPNVVVRGVTLRNGGGSSDVVAVKNQGTLDARRERRHPEPLTLQGQQVRLSLDAAGRGPAHASGDRALPRGDLRVVAARTEVHDEPGRDEARLPVRPPAG